jgi:hypothetical protein
MSSKFESVVQQTIAKYNMEQLSGSVGMPKLREIRRKLEAKSISPEQAIDEFLALRNSYRSKKEDRRFKEEMTKMLR